MFKSFKILLLTLMLLLIHSICLAGISKDEIALGGITPDMNTSSVVKIYGEPKYKEKKSDYWEIWRYGDSFDLIIYNNQVVCAISKANNGMNTPLGIGVGCRIDTVLQVYGKPDLIDSSGYSYYNEPNEMDFAIKNDKVTEIWISNVVLLHKLGVV